MTSYQLLLCLILVIFSGILAGSEVALFSLSRFQIRFLKERFKNSHRKIKVLLADPSGLLITVLVVNEVVNISLSTIISHALSNNFSHLRASIQIIVGLLVTTPIILFACEITPKVIGARANMLIAPAGGSFLYAIYRALIPLRFTIQTSIDRLIALFGSRMVSKTTSDSSAPIKEEEFLLLVEEGHREGAIQESELELIKNVFDLDDTLVEKILVPIKDVFTLNEKTSLQQAWNLVKGKRYTRIPIVNATKKKALGVLHIKDLIQAKLDSDFEQRTVASLMKKPLFIQPDTRLNNLFRRFKQSRAHMGIVESSKGEILGIVAMNDVLDALFDDLYEEEQP